jgi:thiosulfate reductase cytochrome b subunit
MVPDGADLSWRAFSKAIISHLRFERPSEAEAWSYNVLQRLTYLFVIFVLFPLVIWTGLAMSPAFVSAVPAAVTMLGGQQSARTLHFFVSISLLLFLLVHVVMVCIAGFRRRMRAMITGRPATNTERT